MITIHLNNEQASQLLHSLRTHEIAYGEGISKLDIIIYDDLEPVFIMLPPDNLLLS